MKRAFVTGGNRGIGKAIVQNLAIRHNMEIVFTYRSRESDAIKVVDELRFAGAKASTFQMDLLDPVTMKNKIDSEIAKNGPFDVVVHNAAIVADSAFYFMEEKMWNDVIQGSLNSFYIINKACLANMIEKRWGRIITISSVAGEAGNRGQTNYSAAKGAIISASKALGREVAGKGVLVNSVSPGLIETEMTKDVPHGEVMKLIPQGRFGKPEEVANVVGFLASEDSSYINGSVIKVNGGFYT